MENIQKRQNVIFKRMFAAILAWVIMISGVFGVVDFSADASIQINSLTNPNYEFYYNDSSDAWRYNINSSYILNKTNLKDFYLEKYLTPEDCVLYKNTLNEQLLYGSTNTIDNDLLNKIINLRKIVINETTNKLDLTDKSDYEKIRIIYAYVNILTSFVNHGLDSTEISSSLYSLISCDVTAFIALCNNCGLECYRTYGSSGSGVIVSLNNKFYSVQFNTSNGSLKAASTYLSGNESFQSINVSSNNVYCYETTSQSFVSWAKTHTMATEDYYASLASEPQAVSVSLDSITADNYLKFTYPTVEGASYYVLKRNSSNYISNFKDDNNCFYIYLGSDFTSGKEYTFQLCVYNEYGELIGTSDTITKTFSSSQLSSTDESYAAHSFVFSKTIREATYTNKGANLYKCKYCDAEKMVYTDKLTCSSHNYSKTSTTKATTSSNGKIIYTCSVCGGTKTTTIYYPKTISLSTTTYTYDGKVKKPTVTVKDSQGNTISSSNYSVSYSSGLKNVGKYTATVTFKGNYSGSVKKTFTIYPEAPKITSLKNSGDNVKLSIKVSYPSQIELYDVAISTNKKKWSSYGYGSESKKTTTLYMPSLLKNGQVYYIKVKVWGNDSDYTESSYSSIKTIVKLTRPKIKSLVAGKKKITVKYSKNSKATGYQIQYATNKKFTKNKKTVTVKKNTTTSKTIKSLKAKKKYYVRVRTYKTVSGKKYYSSWSKVKSVTTKK